MFNDNLFFDRENNPWESGRLFTERDVMDSFERQQEPFQQFTQQQAQQSIAPNQVPPNLGMAMPQQQGNPMLPPGGAMINPAPPPQAQPQGFNVNSFLNSPGMGMANQALNNMYAMRRGRAPTASPTEAYQQGVNRQALLAQRDKEMVLREKQEARREAMEVRAAEKFERDSNPLSDFNSFVDQRGIQDAPYKEQLTAFQDFQRVGLRGTNTSEMKNLAQRKAMVASIDTGDGRYSQDDLKAFDESVSRTQWLNQGNQFRSTKDGNVVPINLSPADEPEYLRQKANQTASLKTDNDFRGIVDGGHIDSLEQSLENAKNLRARIEAKEIDGTGPIEGQWNMFFGDPQVAGLNMESTIQALENLKITNLAPVTEKEIEMIRDLYAGIGRDPEQNAQLLAQAEKMLTQKMELINKKGQYWADNEGTLRGYGTRRWSKSPPKRSGPERPQ